MKTICLILCVFGLFLQSPNFGSRPWQNGYPLVLDAYHANTIDYKKLVASKKVSAIIFKASDDLQADKGFAQSIMDGKKNGFGVGSYHLGRKSDPIKQADFYLSKIGTNQKFMALDIEGIGNKDISLSDAEKFIQRIFEKTNRYPFLYCNGEVFKAITTKYDRKSQFAKCPLWYARFKDELPILSTKVWDKVTLWQFACEINCQECLEKDLKDNCIKRGSYTPNCPQRIDGTRPDMDINAYNGDINSLKSVFN
jgi:lysozyme